MAIQSINLEILMRNIEVGDFIIISPDKEKEHEKTFLVAKIEGDEVFIHPGSRPSQMHILTPGENQDEWILKSAKKNRNINDWTYSPYDEYEAAVGWVGDIKVTWDPLDARAIQLVKPDNEDAMDYRRIKELVMEDVNVMERDESRPMQRYKVTYDKRNGVHYHGYYEDIRIEAKTFAGARIAYMNWLDTQKIEDNDREMWDQLDQFFFNPKNLGSVEDLVNEFDSGDFCALEQILDEPVVISYPGPQSNRIKAARG